MNKFVAIYENHYMSTIAFRNDSGEMKTMPKKPAPNGDTWTQEDWDESARIIRVMAHPVRLMILDALARKSLCVMDLNNLIPIPQPHLSQHMAALRKAELVDSHKDGSLRCYYLLRPDLIRRFVALFQEKHPVRHRNRDSVQQEVRGERPGSQ